MRIVGGICADNHLTDNIRTFAGGTIYRVGPPTLDHEVAACLYFGHTVIEPFERRLESEKDYYFHTTVLIGLPEGYDLGKLDIPSPKCVIDCRSATVGSVTEAFSNLKEEEHYIVLDDVLSLPKDDVLRQLLYRCVKESVFRADRLIILIFRYENGIDEWNGEGDGDGNRGRWWPRSELTDAICKEFPCIHIDENRKGCKDILYGNFFHPTDLKRQM